MILDALALLALPLFAWSASRPSAPPPPPPPPAVSDPNVKEARRRGRAATILSGLGGTGTDTTTTLDQKTLLGS